MKTIPKSKAGVSFCILAICSLPGLLACSPTPKNDSSAVSSESEISSNPASGDSYVVLARHGRVKSQNDGGGLTPVATNTLSNPLAIQCPTNTVNFYVVNLNGNLTRFKETYEAIKKSFSDGIRSTCQITPTLNSPINIPVNIPGNPTKKELQEIASLISKAPGSTDATATVFVLSGGILQNIGSELGSQYSTLNDILSCKTDSYYYRYFWTFWPSAGGTDFDIIQEPIQYPTLLFPANTPGTTGWHGLLSTLGSAFSDTSFSNPSPSTSAPAVAGFGQYVALATHTYSPKHVLQMNLGLYQDNAITSPPVSSYTFTYKGFRPSMGNARLGSETSLFLAYTDISGALHSITTTDPTQLSTWQDSQIDKGPVDTMYASIAPFKEGSCSATYAYAAYAKPYKNYHQICLSKTSDGTTWTSVSCPFQALGTAVALHAYPVLNQERLFAAYVGSTKDGSQAIFAITSTDGKSWGGPPTTVQSFGPKSRILSLNLAVTEGKLTLFFVESMNPNVQSIMYDDDTNTWGQLGTPLPISPVRPVISAITIP